MTLSMANDRAVKPTRERRRHGLVEQMVGQIADTAGIAGSPWQAETFLAKLERAGGITSAQRAAGEEFHRLFHLAALDPLRAADMGRVGCGYGGVSCSPGSENAHRRVDAALDALGGLKSACGACAYFVLGLDLSLREFAARQQWRGANPHGAKGVLVGTLGVLAKHFGY